MHECLQRPSAEDDEPRGHDERESVALPIGGDGEGHVESCINDCHPVVRRGMRHFVNTWRGRAAEDASGKQAATRDLVSTMACIGSRRHEGGEWEGRVITLVGEAWEKWGQFRAQHAALSAPYLCGEQLPIRLRNHSGTIRTHTRISP
jgi:hypothetical protein